MAEKLTKAASLPTDPCPQTYGRETPEHSVVQITKSSDGQAPYRMCAKCGERWRALQEHNNGG